MSSKEAIEFAEGNVHRFIEELKEFVRIPSVSSSDSHREDVFRCAEYLQERMSEMESTRAEVIGTAGHPIVYGEWKDDPGKPTILIYGHYDVQPADPLDKWKTPPFEPDVREGRMYGRGTVDDKGQVHMHFKALESWIEASGTLPVNVKFVIEGEEEIGSENLGSFLKNEREMLRADVAVVSDTPMFKKGMPSICYGLRGLAYLQIDVRGSKQDLHSGSFGGAAKNPVQALAEMLTCMKDEKGRVLIDGFYDDVVDVTPEEREAFATLPFDEESYRTEIGAPKLFGEAGYTVLENIWCRPTLDVCGIWGGYTEEGAKTIIPSTAHAKVSMRLVPDQSPEKVAGLFEAYLSKIAPPQVEVSATRMHGGMPFLADTAHPSFDAAKRALEKGFGSPAVFIREGGSIPFLETLVAQLSMPCLLIGFGLPGENAHAPNEWIDLGNFEKGILSIIHLYEELSKTDLQE